MKTSKMGAFVCALALAVSGSLFADHHRDAAQQQAGSLKEQTGEKLESAQKQLEQDQAELAKKQAEAEAEAKKKLKDLRSE